MILIPEHMVLLVVSVVESHKKNDCQKENNDCRD